MKPIKILSLSPMPPEFIKSLVASKIEGVEFDIKGVQGKNQEEIKELFKEAEIIIGDYTFNFQVTRELLQVAKNLKFIQQPSVGYQNIDIDSAKEFGIIVSNTAGANTVSVAEHTIMLALMLLKKIFLAHQKTQQGEWLQMGINGSELLGKKWGILGMGRIGIEVTKRLIPFGVSILYFDKIRLSEEKEKELNLEYCSIDKLLRQSDVISIHLPLTNETKGLIGEKELNIMKPSTILINVARSEIVDEEKLANALKRRRIAGAGIDVFSTEPVQKDNVLLQAPNVILSPHIAGVTNEARQRIIEKTISNVERFIKGEKPVDIVNQ